METGKANAFEETKGKTGGRWNQQFLGFVPHLYISLKTCAIAASLLVDRNAPAEGQKIDGRKWDVSTGGRTAASECGCRRCWSSARGPKRGEGTQGASLLVLLPPTHTPGRKVAELRGKGIVTGVQWPPSRL